MASNKDRFSSQLQPRNLINQFQSHSQGQISEEQKKSDEKTQNNQLDEFQFFEKHHLQQIYEHIYSLKINQAHDTVRDGKSKMPTSMFPPLMTSNFEMIDKSQLQIKESDIKHQLYRHVMKQELKKIKKKFRHFQIYSEDKSYQRLLVCFWLAIHQERHTVVKFLYDRFDLIQQVVQVLYEQASANKDKVLKEIADLELYILKDEQPEAELINDLEFLDISKETNYKTPEYLKLSSKIPTSLSFLPYEIKEILRSRGELLKSQNATQSEEISPFMSDIEERQVKSKIKTIKRMKMEISIKEIKLLLMTSIGKEYCTQVLNITLNDEEHRIALVLAVYYKVQVSQQNIYRALCMKNIHFIKLLLTTDVGKRNGECNTSPELLSPGQKMMTTITMKSLVFMIKNFRQECIDYALSDERVVSVVQREKVAQQQVEAINDLLSKIIYKWPLRECLKANILQTLLAFDMEDLAWQAFFGFEFCCSSYLSVNREQLTDEIVKDSILQVREKLVRKAFKFDHRYEKVLEDQVVISFILNQIQKKHECVFFVLWLLKKCNLNSWSVTHMNQLFQSILEISTDEHEKNLITAVHNPILAIALCCELLNKMGQCHSYLVNNCKTQESFVLLVQKIIDNQEDLTLLGKLLTELDSEGRSALQIINQLNLSKMICSPKVTRIVDELWTGKDVQRCNGKIQDFSCLYSRVLDNFDYSHISFIYDEMGRRIISNKLRFWDVVLGSFQKPKIDEQKYFFQYTYRHSSIEYLYWKEFALSFLVVVIFQYVSYTYLTSFNLQNIEINGHKIQERFEENHPELIENLSKLIKAYGGWSRIGLVISGSIFLHFLQKILFSIQTKKRFRIDLWTQIDILTALCNSFCLYVTSTVDEREMLNIKLGDRADTSYLEDDNIGAMVNAVIMKYLDYYVCAVVTITWLRFFSYFLIVKRVSKLLITLVTMIQNTLSFFFMFSCYFIIAATIFHMRFGTVNEENYGTVLLSMRHLFDAFASEYRYIDFFQFQRAYDIFFIIHQIITRVFLLNYLVAVLTTIYQFMIVGGEYTYSRMRYFFYKKYQQFYVSHSSYESQLNHKKNHYYSELTIHPPPMNLVVIAIQAACLPVHWNLKFRLMVLKFIGLVIFWIENVLFLAVFLAFEMLCAVGVYFKVLIVFMIKIGSKRKSLLFFCYWIVLGLPIVIGLAFKDTYNLFLIFKQLDIDQRIKKEKSKLEKERAIQSLQVNILNEVIDSMLSLYQEIEDKQKHEHKKKDSDQINRQKLNQFTSKQNLVKKLSDLKKGVLNPQEKQVSFTIDKDLVIMAWLKMRRKRIEQSRAKQNKYNNQDNPRTKKSTFIVPPPSRIQTGFSIKLSPAQMYGQRLMQNIIDQNQV